MKRYPHYWWQLRGSYCPSRIAVLVYESEPVACAGGGNPTVERAVGWHLFSAEMVRGRCVRTTARHGESAEASLGALALFTRSRETTWVFMPRAVDGLIACGLFNALSSGAWQLCGKDWRTDRGMGKSGEDRTDGLCCIEDPPTLILASPRDGKGRILFLDTMNYGIERCDTGSNASHGATCYLAGILSVLSALRQTVPVSLRGTAASQAVQILRTRYDCVRLHCHTHAAATRLERAAYFGGRVEAYRTGVIPGPVYHVDVRSMYPSIGLTLPIPVSLRSYHGESGDATEVVGRDPSACVAHARVLCDEPRIPVRRDGEIAYPHGEFDTYLAGPELLSAVGAGLVRQVYAAARYTCAPYLAGFYQWGLEALARARAKGQGFLVQWLKRVMNALPGKLGEPGRRWVPCHPRTERDDYDEWREPGPDGTDTRHRNIAGYTQREETHGESYWSMPAIAAWITSAARLRLWHYLETAGRENVWYADTDGLLTGQAGFDRLLGRGLVGTGAPGDLRLIGCYSSATVYGVRHYKLGDTIRCAGVPRGAIADGETREDYFRRCPGSAETTLGRIRRMTDG